VATFHFHISSVGRSAGRRATAAAAYRAGERLRDERTGRVYNHSGRKDVAHAEIFLPSHLKGAAGVWAQNREKLWNTAERAEKRANSRVAREYQVSLPHELDRNQQLALARALSRELAERYNVAVDLAVHLPRPDGDPRNFHAHLLTTTREVTPQGLGAKTGLDMQSRERRRRELPDWREEVRTLRARWATLSNEALREANVEARVDHRSLAERGIAREPRPHIPMASLKMEQRGVRSVVAERIREDYRRRVAARLERAAQATTAPESAAQSNGKDAGAQPKDLEEIRRQAREAWRQLRAREADGHSEPRQSGREPERENRESETAVARRDDDDLAL
jgi:ATP-dependent exoDNAse (exonuclease V) alpha subunit